MGEERKDALAALESLAWHLNFFPGQTVSIAPVAKATNLAWGTTHKYAVALETISKALPQLRVDDEGISVMAPNSRWSDVVSDPLSGTLLYVFLHGRMIGNPSAPLSLSNHALFGEHYEAGLQRAEDVDLVDIQEKRVKLTPSGLSLAARLFDGITQEPEELAWITTSEAFSNNRVEQRRLEDAAAA